MSRNRLSVLLFCLASCLGSAARAGEGDTLITDPALLSRLGFPPDARNVYLAKGAILDQRSSPAEPEEFGTADFGWTTVLGTQHHPLGASMSVGAADGSIYGSGTFDAQLHMPSGALLRQVVWFGRDDEDDVGPEGRVFGQLLRVCQTGIPVGPPLGTHLGNGQSTAGDFTFAVVVPPGEVVNNLSCAYIARTTFQHSSGSAISDLVLRKVRVGWQRQVSTAPLTASFPNDTPTTHPYFQFIEALAAAGITGGCAPGSFCPENPITRGEMAVFLSVALGLHFPN